MKNLTKLKCAACGSDYEKHDFTYPELCVFCSDIKMMDDIDEEEAAFGIIPTESIPGVEEVDQEEKSYTFVYPRFKTVINNLIDIEEVTVFVNYFTEKYNLAGSCWDWNGAKVLDEKGDIVGKVSFNGRVWDESDNEVTD